MATELVNLKAFFFRLRALVTRIGSQFSSPWKLSPANTPRLKHAISSSLNQTSSAEVAPNQALVFHLEGAVLKSSSIFPYFMLVAFEAGGLLRALVLFLLYPFVCLAGEDQLGLKIMVFVCFFGVRKKTFRDGRAVLPKFFFEDVGTEGFDMVMRFRRRIGVTNLPRIMVESFLVDYLGVDAIVGRELKVVCGYFVGLMEEKKASDIVLNQILGEEKVDSCVIGLSSIKKSLDQQLLSHCKVLHLVSESEKRNWQVLPRKKYPKPLIFHDGRLAFKPDFLATLEIFLWLPFGFLLFIIRLIVSLSLPHKLSIPFMSFTGMTGTDRSPQEKSLVTPSNTSTKRTKGILYVCNHRTLLDPIYVSIGVKRPLIAVTYSLSRISELISPIKTVRLTRNREKDSETMAKLLSQSDLVVCPEGTTCREPYLLRFSPLFAELTDEIVPVAVDYRVSMFYGTTAGGYKFLDPVFLLLNPITTCTVKVLEKLPEQYTCGVGGKSKFEVANYVQSKIAEALGFECTNMTRKDKYIILAGNEGKV